MLPLTLAIYTLQVFQSPTHEVRDSMAFSLTSTAEQKRRSHIKNGFDAIQSLVPALANNPNNKVSLFNHVHTAV